MKRVLALLLALLAVTAMLAACGKKEVELDPNAVLTDSDIPLDVGAEIIEDDTDPPANPSRVAIGTEEAAEDVTA